MNCAALVAINRNMACRGALSARRRHQRVTSGTGHCSIVLTKQHRIATPASKEPYMPLDLFTTIHDGNFRRHSSMNVTIK